MKFCLNQVKKCCGCLDIRTGAYLIAFLSLIRVFVYLFFIPEAFLGYDSREYILPIIGGTLLLITIDIILIVGLVKNRTKYLNIWLFIEGSIILVRIVLAEAISSKNSDGIFIGILEEFKKKTQNAFVIL